MNDDIHDMANDIVNNFEQEDAKESLESAFVAGRLSAAFYAGLIEDLDWDDDRALHVVAMFGAAAFERMVESLADEEGGGLSPE